MKLIKDYENYAVSEDGRVFNVKTGKLKVAGINKDNGYLQVELYRSNIRKHFYVHRLVALAYLPNPFNLPEVNHKNSNRKDPHKGNLEWVTSSGNSIHAVKHGQRDHIPRMSKISIEDVFKLIMEGNSYKDVSMLLHNSWQPGFLSVKVGEFAKSINKLNELKAELKRQRIVRSLRNLESINNV